MFRRVALAPVTARLRRIEETQVPSWLWRSSPDERRLAELPQSERLVGETDARQVFDRLAGTWTYWGWKGGYFSSEDDARAFHDELRHMLAKQMVAPNSPQWFNTGLHWAYGIDGPGQGHYYVDWKTGRLTKSKSAYEHPQPHACFIQSINDDLVNEGGIMDLWVREARIFKYGSGTGSNFSNLRGEGEPLVGALYPSTHPFAGERSADQDDLPVVARNHAAAGRRLLDDELDLLAALQHDSGIGQRRQRECLSHEALVRRLHRTGAGVR